MAIASVLLAGLAVALWSGAPQDAAFEWAVGDALGASVEVEGLRLAGAVQFSELRISDGPTEPAAFIFRDVCLDYTLPAQEGVLFPSLRIGQVAIDFANPSGDDTNYDFLLRLLMQPGSADGGPFVLLIKEVGVEAVSFKTRQPGLDIALESVALTMGAVDSLQEFVLDLEADPLTGYVRTADGTQSVTLDGGVVSLRVIRDRRTVYLRPLDARIPGVGHLRCFASISQGAESTVVEADLMKLELEGNKTGDLLSVLSGLPVRFDQANLPEGGIVVEFGDVVRVLELHVKGIVEALALGEPEQEVRCGDVRVAGSVKDDGGEFEITLDDNQRVHVTAKADSAARFEAHAELERVDPMPWLILAFGEAPVDVTGAHVSGEMNLLEAEAFSGDAVLAMTGLGDDGAGGSIMDLEFAGPSIRAPWPLTVSGTAAFPGESAEQGVARLQFTVAEGTDGVHGVVELEDLDLPGVASLVRAWPLGPDWAGRASGTVGVATGAEGTRFDLAVEVNPATLAGITLPPEHPLGIAGGIRLDEMGNPSGDMLKLTLPALLEASFGDWSVELETGACRGDLEATVEVPQAASLFELGPFVGVIECAKAPLTFADGTLSTTLVLSGRGLGYDGSFTTPPDTEITAEGDLQFDTNSFEGAVTSLKATWPVGTTLTSEKVRFSTDPLNVEGPVVIETDLSPLVEMGYVATATGSAKVTGHVEYDEQGLAGAWAAQLEAQSLVLLDDMAALGGILGELDLECTGQWSGSGRLGIAEVRAAGGLLEMARARLEVTGATVRFGELEGRIYGGALEGSAQLEFSAAGVAVKLDVTFEDVDLDRFTREYELPSAALTGRAKGRLVVEWGPEQLNAFRFALVSDDGFTVNRDFVEQLLLSEYTQGYTGGKTLDKITQRIIGEAGQRPFDSASVSLRDDGAALVGQAVLRSELLNMSVNLDIDVAEVNRALEMHQEMQLDKLDTVNTEPVQWYE